MLPSHYVQLDALPLNANGKLDKKALPNPETLGLSSGVAYIAPRNKTEEQLVEIWKEILGKEKIGIHDNFFELGGHSLKLTRLSTQLHKIFNAHIDLKDLFTTPTIAQQAQLVQQSHKTAYNIIAKAPAQRSYPLSSAQQRLWILSQFEESSKAYNMPGVYVFEGDLDKAALENAFNTLIERHEILRTVFKQDEQAEVQQYIQTSQAVNFTIQYIDANKKQLGYPAIQNLVQKEIEKPFDLSTGPLLRASLYKIAHHQWVFVYVMHHIISDGWSMSILIKEILHYYKYSTKQTAHLLQPLSIQYKDYAVWQQQQLHSESLQTDKNYWLQQLQGDIPVLEMPTDKPRPAVKTYNGNVIQQTIHPSLTKKIKALSQQEGATLFMSLLA
ncbi:MAG TPA: condensation domain-containing protein, partial [Chitinophagaceae bacterium]|nr:condensation domain-containing protein [Chitinophagaceae bacterium]